MSTFVDTSVFALNIATGLSLGLAVDYALLMVSRYREEMGRDGADARGAPPHRPHRRANRALLRPHRRRRDGGPGRPAAALPLLDRRRRSLGRACSPPSLALLVVPSLLALLGTRIDALSIRRGPAVSDESDGWYRLARGVMRHPVGVALASSGLLLAAASPLLWTTLTGPSAEAVPAGKPSYKAYKYLDAHYPRDVTEAVTVTVDGRATTPSWRLRPTDQGARGVARGTPLVRASDQVAYANYGLGDPALAEGSQDTVREIRDLSPAGRRDRPRLRQHRQLHRPEAEPARPRAARRRRSSPPTTLLILFLLTGSVLLPLKTLLMNAMTLGATLGIVVLAFQDGWLDGLFDYTGPSAVEVTSLVFLFAVIFGLATDYAVLVMARIKEQYDLGASNEEAVAIGIGRTGRVITAAALLIAVVFLAFGVSRSSS